MADLDSVFEEEAILWNPLPKVKQAEVFKAVDAAKEPLDKFQFQVDLQWNAGARAKHKTLIPGEEVKVKQGVAQDLWSRDVQEQGVVLLKAGDDRRTKALQGLNKALVFYREFGTRKIEKTRKELNLDPAGMKERRVDYEPLYVNAHCEELISKEIARLKAKGE